VIRPLATNKTDSNVSTGCAKPAHWGGLERVHTGDNLPIMRTMPGRTCDLLYADPPFNTNRIVGAGHTSGLAFQDVHVGGLDGYLSFLKPRFIEMRRLLSARGTLYVHLDGRTVHYVKVLLDEVFGAAHFLNEIIWSYRSGSRSGRWFPKKHDTLLVYAKRRGGHTFNAPRGGTYRTRDLKRTPDGRLYKSTRNGPIFFHREGPLIGDVWDLPILSTVSCERTGYPSQKPEALLDRIIRASSNEGDVVGDFFCGSGTTLAVAKRLSRRWIGCDSNPQAVEITRARLARVDAQPPC